MIALVTAATVASDDSVMVKGSPSLRYTFAWTNRTDDDPTGATRGLVDGTLTLKVRARETYTRITTPAVAATGTINPAGANNSLDVTAVVAGLAGNAITIVGVDTAVPSQALAFELSGSQITAKLALDAGTQQQETCTVVGTITLAGTVTWTFTSALTGEITGEVDVEDGAVNGEVAALIHAALEAHETITEHFGIFLTGADIDIAPLVAAANDPTLNLAYANGTATGLTDDATSTNTTAGVAPAITTTGDLFKAGAAADAAVAALISLVDSAANDGSGLMAAFAVVTLASGAEAVTEEDRPEFPLTDSLMAELEYDLASFPVGGVDFVAPVSGDFLVEITGATNGKHFFFHLAPQIQ